MKSPKRAVQEILKKLPENSSFEDIQYHIYVREKIEKGLQDIKAGKLMSQEEVEKRMSKWL